MTTDKFENITQVSHDHLQKQIDSLKISCENNHGVKEMVEYILAHAETIDYNSTVNRFDADVGREIIQMIWEITGMDLSTVANPYHFDSAWAGKLNHFISNYIYDDSAFYFVQNERTGVYSFKSSTDNDPFYQDARLIVAAARANRVYFSLADSTPILERHRQGLRVCDDEIQKILKEIKGGS